VQEIAALAGRVADPATARATAGAFPTLLDDTEAQASGLEGRSAPSRTRFGCPAAPLPFRLVLPGPYLRQPVTTSPYAATSYASPLFAYGSSQGGLRVLAAAAGELGVQEEPPGSNDGPRIAQYRAASGAEATPGRWCAYFVSWSAAQAGAPLGEGGQGYGAVSQIHDWAQRSGRLVRPASRRGRAT
jgi:hypothetical protein